MRMLSKEEQDLCKRILKGSGQNNFLGNIIDHKLSGVCISITRQPQNVELEFSNSNPVLTDDDAMKMVDRINEISFLILTTVNLINLLEKEGYIMLIRRGKGVTNFSKFGRCIGNIPSVTSYFGDKSISDLLIDYVDKEMIATVEFQRFCKRKFIARDEQRFKIQFRITLSALLVAILALLLNTFFNALSRFTGGTKIKTEQIDTLSKGLNLVENELKLLNRIVTDYSSKPSIPDTIISKTAIKNQSIRKTTVQKKNRHSG